MPSIENEVIHRRIIFEQHWPGHTICRVWDMRKIENLTLHCTDPK